MRSHRGKERRIGCRVRLLGDVAGGEDGVRLGLARGLAQHGAQCVEGAHVAQLSLRRSEQVAVRHLQYLEAASAP